MADILVVDDDQSVATAFKHFLTFDGHTCRLASNAQDAARQIEERRPNLVMMDVRMPGIDGVEALQQFRARFPGLYVVIMTAYGTSQTSIDAIRAGAFDYLMKPLDLDELRAVIARALAAQDIAAGASAAQAGSAAAPPLILIGDSPPMIDLYKTIGRLATNDVPALVVGERGTGKHLVVATIHDNSARRGQPLIRLDAATATDADLNAKLFEPAGGTVQLAHVDRLTPGSQAAIAHALKTERTRGDGPRVAARIIATVDHDLADAARTGAFSQELLDEIGVITLRLPPLRERREDIPLLVRHFIHRFNTELNREIRGIDDRVARHLQEHAWPGNVGQLERVVKRACIVARSDVITMDVVGDSSSDSRTAPQGDPIAGLEGAVRAALHDRLVQAPSGASGDQASPFHDIVDVVETTLVAEALTITNGNQVKASEILGVNRATLRKKMAPES